MVSPIPSLLGRLCRDPEACSVPGPGRALAEVHPPDPDCVAKVIQRLVEARVPWAVGPLDHGLIPDREVVLVSLDRLTHVEPVDEVDHLVRVQAGVRTDTLVRLLRDAGYTPGPLPRGLMVGRLFGGGAWRMGWPGARVGLWDRLAGLVALLPTGELLSPARAPRKATGPGMEALVVGAEGTCGLILEASLRVEPLPEAEVRLGYRFETPDGAAAALRHLHGRHLPLAAAWVVGDALYLVVSGPRARVDACKAAVDRLLGSVGLLGELPGAEPTMVMPHAPRPDVALQRLRQEVRARLDPLGLFQTWAELAQGA